jgi:hypothetical protein
MWTEATAAQNVTLDMAWGLVLGDATAETWPYAARPIQQELALCLRYFVSGTAFTQGSRDSSLANGRLRLGFTFPQPMRGIPAMSYPALGGAADGEGSAVSFPQGGGAFNRTNLLGTIFDGFVASGTSTTVNVPWTVTFPYFADAEL